MNAPLKNAPKHFLDLSDHDSATLKAMIADARRRKQARAGLSKGALYWHYDGKEALYLDCLQRLHALFDHYIF